mmetsp:Transcript_64333/g.106554  ORF Transcript_64333/g.106554 Transcript_64333/m.106554 type:complete len:176 (-) Transcript_64333:107-634(-)
MNAKVLVLTCLACAGHARRVQTPTPEQDEANQVSALANFLMAFNPSGPTPIGGTSKSVVSTPSSVAEFKDPLGLYRKQDLLEIYRKQAALMVNRVPGNLDEETDGERPLLGYLSTAPVLLTINLIITASALIEIQRAFPSTQAFWQLFWKPSCTDMFPTVDCDGNLLEEFADALN